MTLSEDTSAVVEFLDQYSEGGLRKKNDLGVILEISAQSCDFKAMNQIVFAGKSVRNLYSKLKRTQDGNAEIIHKQLAATADELRVLLDEVVSADFPEQRKRFEQTYLEATSGCLANLIDLSHDLSVLKDVQASRSEIIKSEDELQ